VPAAVPSLFHSPPTIPSTFSGSVSLMTK
jgi:hypothetical protein